MADIDVVPKSRRHVWLWVVLAIVAAVIAWMVVGGMSRDANRVGELFDRTPAAMVVGGLHANAA